MIITSDVNKAQAARGGGLRLRLSAAPAPPSYGSPEYITVIPTRGADGGGQRVLPPS